MGELHLRGGAQQRDKIIAVVCSYFLTGIPNEKRPHMFFFTSGGDIPQAEGERKGKQVSYGVSFQYFVW